MESTLFIIICVLALIGYLVLKHVQWVEQERRIRALRVSDIDQMTGFQFELYVARLYQHRGYSTTVTKGSNDLGVDVIASRSGERLAIQVKRHSKKVSRRAVSDAVAGMRHYGCNGAAVVTNNYFGPGATALARSNGCQLIDRETLTNWIIAFQGHQLARPVGQPQSGQSSYIFPDLVNRLAEPPPLPGQHPDR